MMNPTDEQSAIISAVKGSSDNILVNALAGCGKTTTLDFIQAASPTKPILCLAFNKRIAKEMEERFGNGTTTVRTFNSLGHRIWAKAVGKVVLHEKKIGNLLSEEIKSLKGEDRKEAGDAYWDIIGALGLAKALGYVPDGKFAHAKRLITEEQFHASLDSKPSSLTCELIDNVLIASIRAAYEGSIDYNDQIYMPALFGGTFPRFPLVLVDEGQDLSPTNHAMLDKLVKERLGVVGDRWQSIYAFRGAKTEGINALKDRFSCKEFDLSASFRCPKRIVEAARWRVPHFKWIKDGGHHEILQDLRAGDIPDSAAIICRNNAPLFRLAFGLLASKRSVQVAGSDIGPRLIKIMQKLGDSDTSRANLFELIMDWKSHKMASTTQPQTIEDMAASMRIFAGFGETLGQAVAYAQHLFAQQGTIRLLTGHKAKGGEWPIVYHLDPWLIGDSEQELNLRYVIQTRAMDSYYEIDSNRIRWTDG